MYKIALFFLLSASSLLSTESSLKDEQGKTIIQYVVEAPPVLAPAHTTDPAKQLGLILCFPEHDRPVGDEIYPVREALKRLGISDQFVLLAGGPQGHKFGPVDYEPIGKLIAWAQKTYPINPRRIYMYGKGEGGKISGELVMRHPDLITASISYSWGWWTMPSELKTALDAEKSAPEIYMVLGLRDLSYHLTNVRDAYSRVSAKGYHVIFREFEDLGARTYHPASNDDALAWASRLRNKNLPLSAEEQKLLKPALYTAAAAKADGYFPKLALVGGPAAGSVVQQLLRSTDPAIRAAAAQTCIHGTFDEATMAALGQRLTDEAPIVRRIAARALALQANWRSQEAQQALIRLATGIQKAVDRSDRVAAADGIVEAIRLQKHGVRQDPALFQAMITLLEDQDEELRTIANNTLAPLRDREFRGDLGRPERKIPEGGWTAWIEKVKTKAAGYQKDYEVCGWGSTHQTAALPGNRGQKEAVDLYCQGGSALLGENLATGKPIPKDPVQAFQLTQQAADQGYVPAQAALGMMFAVGKGVQQNLPEAAKWWVKAAEGGHVLAATNASMILKGGGGVKADAAAAERWAKFAAEHSSPGQD
ncbi:SEL1-like repeat protein [Bryobacter aggregatus]|uniref:SEL1-like repeat protein n=1 Tax=Bryobacter aggregatus TaxID=360054 RepID=UPI0004E25145|nr:SEL1-like repeat protein [Bryobacter aggregatus]